MTFVKNIKMEIVTFFGMERIRYLFNHVKNGKYYDAWDSGKINPIYYFEKVSDGEQNQVIKNV